MSLFITFYLILKTSFMHANELKSTLQQGLLSFPLTDFDQQLQFNARAYTDRLEWLMPYGASVLFAAGGTGEFFSLEPIEFTEVIKVAVQTCKGRVPIVAGAGGATKLAIQYAQAAENAGAQGILLLPHYLTEASQEGLIAHVQAVCASVKLGVIVYNRGACKLNAHSLQILADSCPNLIGYKDGLGDIECMVSIRLSLGDRFAYLGGLPTAEVYAHAYEGLGVPTYSSAVFNFIPRTAIDFYKAYQKGDRAITDHLIKTFFLPYIALRNQGQGYAVSIVKAGATIVGRTAGPVRPPLSDMTPSQTEQLRELIQMLGSQS
jgi:5-dehydro-4-deoxyglucarate dehydratase